MYIHTLCVYIYIYIYMLNRPSRHRGLPRLREHICEPLSQKEKEERITQISVNSSL